MEIILDRCSVCDLPLVDHDDNEVVVAETAFLVQGLRHDREALWQSEDGTPANEVVCLSCMEQGIRYDPQDGRVKV